VSIRHTCDTCGQTVVADGADEYRAALAGHRCGQLASLPSEVFVMMETLLGQRPADPMGGPPAQAHWFTTAAPHIGTLWLVCECGEKLTAPTYYGLMGEEAHHTYMCTANGQPKREGCACVDGIQCFKHWQEQKQRATYQTSGEPS
jgi:hypothetical protein